MLFRVFLSANCCEKRNILPKMIGMDTFGLRKKRVQIRYPFRYVLLVDDAIKNGVYDVFDFHVWFGGLYVKC